MDNNLSIRSVCVLHLTASSLFVYHIHSFRFQAVCAQQLPVSGCLCTTASGFKSVLLLASGFRSVNFRFQLCFCTLFNLFLRKGFSAWPLCITSCKTLRYKSFHALATNSKHIWRVYALYQRGLNLNKKMYIYYTQWALSQCLPFSIIRKLTDYYCCS